MFDNLYNKITDLIDLFFSNLESMIRVITKKHFLIRLSVFSILWVLWLILFPIFIIGHICKNLDIDTELFSMYGFCLLLFASLILYPHQVNPRQVNPDNEQHKWIKENLKRGTYVLFFDELYFMNLCDVMAFKLMFE